VPATTAYPTAVLDIEKTPSNGGNTAVDNAGSGQPTPPEAVDDASQIPSGMPQTGQGSSSDNSTWQVILVSLVGLAIFAVNGLFIFRRKTKTGK
jgi:hypothetical protein